MPFYRCENEYGDACTYARENRKISKQEAVSSMEQDGSPPKCPGKTLSGKPCGRELVPIPEPKPPVDPILVAALGGGGILALTTAFWFLVLPMITSSPPIMQVKTDPIIFPAASTGAATGSIEISNQGKGTLRIEQITAEPAHFVPTTKELQIEPEKSATLFVNFHSDSSVMVEGTLIFQSNDEKNSSTSIKLIANRNPWWVYEQLERSSKILRPEDHETK